MNDPKVTAVVVTYNRLPLLRECLDALVAQTRPLDQILVIDNCSTDDTPAYLSDFTARHADLCRVIRLPENLGGAGGFSAGLKDSVLGGADYTWLLDDDTIASPAALAELLKVAVGRQAGFACSKVLWTDGKLHPRNLPGGRMVRLSDGHRGPDYDALSTCELSTFVSVLVSSRAVYRVGLPVKEFFIWCDDIEYTQRISQGGFTNYYVPASCVVHKTAQVGSYSLTYALPETAGRFYYQVRNACYIKHRQQPNKWLFRLSVWNKYRIMKRRIKKRKDGHEAAFLDAVTRGVHDGKTFYPEIEYLTPPAAGSSADGTAAPDAPERGRKA